jgi:hypothetical protein
MAVERERGCLAEAIVAWGYGAELRHVVLRKDERLAKGCGCEGRKVAVDARSK